MTTTPEPRHPNPLVEIPMTEDDWLTIEDALRSVADTDEGSESGDARRLAAYIYAEILKSKTL